MTDALDMSGTAAAQVDTDRDIAFVELLEDAEDSFQTTRRLLEEAAEASPSMKISRRLRAYEEVMADPEVFCRRTAGQYRAGKGPREESAA